MFQIWMIVGLHAMVISTSMVLWRAALCAAAGTQVRICLFADVPC
jgi:hypothetical protein